MKCPVNRTTAPNILRLFDYCFKQGVKEAMDMEDDYAVKEWVERREENHDYGLLSEPGEGFDWKRWRFTLYRWCRENRLNTIAENYIDRLRVFQGNMTFAIIPISMQFYLMGVGEWLEYPNPLAWAIFSTQAKIHWKPLPKHLKRMNAPDIVNIVQGMVYKRVSAGIEGDMTDRQYNDFALALWRGTQKYPVYGSEQE